MIRRIIPPVCLLTCLVSQHYSFAQGVSGGAGVSNAPVLQRYLTANLPTCGATLAGALAIVTDGTQAAVGTTIAGSSASTIIVACSSAGNWVVN